MSLVKPVREKPEQFRPPDEAPMRRVWELEQVAAVQRVAVFCFTLGLVHANILIVGAGCSEGTLMLDAAGHLESGPADGIRSAQYK